MGCLWAFRWACCSSAWLLASAFQSPAYRGFAYFAMFCSLPTYLMLWNAQAHIFLIVAVGMILSGLMRLAEEPHAERYGRWIQLGLVIAMLSKPVVILMLPVLFLLPETRKLLLPLAVYAAVSLLCLIAGDVNPGGYNGIHWLNIVGAGSGTRQSLNRLVPTEFDLLQNLGLYSLPIFVNRNLGYAIPAAFFRIPLVAVLVMSFSPLVLDEREQRLRSGAGDRSVVHPFPFLMLLPGPGISLHDAAGNVARIALALAA